MIFQGVIYAVFCNAELKQPHQDVFKINGSDPEKKRGIQNAHGESSFLQAYLEGGISGLILSLLPFLRIAAHSRRSNLERRTFLILGYIVGLFLMDAVEPIFGNIPLQVLLGFLTGALYTSKKPYTFQIKR